MRKIFLIFLFFFIAITFLSSSTLSKTYNIKYSLDSNLSSSDASFLGEKQKDMLGESVAIIGDVNGDGYDDILLSAPYNDQSGTDAGKIYLIFGEKDNWQKDTTMDEVDASFLGEYKYDNAGEAIAGVGDVNGDGYEDFVIGAPQGGLDKPSGGITYLIFGKSTGWSKDMLLSDADASFIGPDSDDDVGDSLAGAGDVNDDGYNDILIGSPQDDAEHSFMGRTYLVLGKHDGWKKNMSLANADASFIGELKEDYAGYSVAGVGDVNGDDYDDMLIAAAHNDEGGYAAGQVYLIFGKNVGWKLNYSLSMSDASFLGEKENSSLGHSVAGAGDVNKDGYDDFLIGSPGMDSLGSYTGKTYLVLGKADGWSMDTKISEADASFIGEKEYSFSGGSVAKAGDVNGDGYDDFLIGAGGDENGTGQIYVILGKATGRSKNINLTMADASFIGENAHDWAGDSISGGGDINGDGYDDILVGAIWNDETGTDAGQAYLIFLKNKQNGTQNGIFDNWIFFIVAIIIVIIIIVGWLFIKRKK